MILVWNCKRDLTPSLLLLLDYFIRLNTCFNRRFNSRFDRMKERRAAEGGGFGGGRRGGGGGRGFGGGGGRGFGGGGRRNRDFDDDDFGGLCMSNSAFLPG